MMRSALMLAAALSALGCQERRIEPPVPVESTPTSPVDHVAEGELLRGTERAFGLVLPRGFVVRARFSRSVLAEGPASAERLATYLGAQLKDGEASRGPSRASFSKVRVPTEPARLLSVRVDETRPGFCQLQINDDTEAVDLGGSPAERLSRAGRTADGSLKAREQQE